MIALFDVGPSYDPFVVGIINAMLLRLKNNKPKPESDVYARNAQYIHELYDGTFLRHLFRYSNENQYNLEGVEDKVKECKGSWQAVRDLVLTSIEHYETAKGKDYMPFNKKFLNGISFANFFEGSMRFNPDGAFDSNFMKFINEPKKSYSYNSSQAIQKIKDELPSSLVVPAEKFAKKYFKMVSMELNFWYYLEDWNRWIKDFRKAFPETSSEFFLACEDGNMFTDFSQFLIDRLKRKSGDNPVVNAYYFKMTIGDSEILSGMFKDWLVSGMNKGKFAMLKNLPDSIDKYYSDESFRGNEIKTVKPVINADEFPIF